MSGVGRNDDQAPHWRRNEIHKSRRIRCWCVGAQLFAQRHQGGVDEFELTAHLFVIGAAKVIEDGCELPSDEFGQRRAGRCAHRFDMRRAGGQLGCQAIGQQQVVQAGGQGHRAILRLPPANRSGLRRPTIETPFERRPAMTSTPPQVYLVVTNGLSATCAKTEATPFATLDGALAHAEAQIRDWGQNSRYEEDIERFVAEFQGLDDRGEPVHHVQIDDDEEIFISVQEARP